MNNDYLPSGWSNARLEDMAEINPTTDFVGLDDHAGVSFLPMAAVEEESGRIDLSWIRPLGEVRKGYTRFQDGDILFAKITPCMENGKIAVAQGLTNGFGCGTTEFHVIRPHQEVPSTYLRYFLLQWSFRQGAERNMQGAAGQRRVPTKYVAKAAIPLPPANEQRRIVEKIDELFSDIEQGEAALRRAKALLKRYRQAVLKAAVTGALTRDWREQHAGTIETGEQLLQRILEARRAAWEKAELARKGQHPKDDSWKCRYKEPTPPDTTDLPPLPDGWVWIDVQSVAELVTDGDHNPPRRFPTGIPHLTAKNVVGWKFDLSGCSFVSAEGFAQTRSRYEPKAGDVIVTCVGTIGRTAIVPDGFEFSADRNLAAVRPVEKVISAQYLQITLNAPYLQSMLTEASGSTAQPHLYLADLRKLPIPIPSLGEQEEIVQRASEALSEADAGTGEIERSERQSAQLRQSTLTAALSGKLVPQDPSDEPASKLLERIAAERAARASIGQPRRRGPGRRREEPEKRPEREPVREPVLG